MHSVNFLFENKCQEEKKIGGKRLIQAVLPSSALKIFSINNNIFAMIEKNMHKYLQQTYLCESFIQVIQFTVYCKSYDIHTHNIKLW